MNKRGTHSSPHVLERYAGEEDGEGEGPLDEHVDEGFVFLAAHNVEVQKLVRVHDVEVRRAQAQNHRERLVIYYQGDA